MTADSEKGKYTTPEGSKTWEYLTIFTCSIMSGCVGSIVGWNSPSIVILMSDDSPIPVSASDISTLVATVAVGHMIAPPLNTVLVDRIGRKNTMLLTALPLIVSWAMITVATTVWELYIARLMSGLTLGLFICVGPMYIGEVSSPETRGAGSSLTAIIYNIGILACFIVAPHLSLSVTAGICLLVSISFLAAFWFMPESPYFLIMQNRTDEAEEVLEKLRGKTDVTEELEAIVASLSKNEKELVKSGGLKDIFTVRGNFRAFLIILLFTVTHHFGGFYTVLMYGQLIFRANKSSISDYALNVTLGVVQLISALMTSFLVDRLGRKPLILASGVTAAICNAIIGLFFYAKDFMKLDVSTYSWAPFVAIMVLVFAFNCGLMCLQIVMMSEIFATEIKAISTCLVGIIGGLLATLGIKLYIWIAITLNYGHSLPFLGFAVVVALCTAGILYLAPETKGKTFLEIQKELNK